VLIAIIGNDDIPTKILAKEEFSEKDWPYTVKSLRVECYNELGVIGYTDDGRLVGLNGSAKNLLRANNIYFIDHYEICKKDKDRYGVYVYYSQCFDLPMSLSPCRK
jgi:hypothetical protein